MIRYKNLFKGYVVDDGLETADWSLRISENSTAIARDSLAFFDSGRGAEFNKASSGRDQWTWDSVQLRENVDIKALIRPSAVDSFGAFGLGVRLTGNDDNNDSGYAFRFLDDGEDGSLDTVDILKIDDGVTAVVDSASFSWAIDTNYYMRLRVIDTSIKAKVWEEGESEPETWLIDTNDSDISGEGRIGIYYPLEDNEFYLGEYQVTVADAVWPETLPCPRIRQVSGGPQSNKAVFTPEVGETIDRRRATLVARNYEMTLQVMTQDQYNDFLNFYHTTLVDGIKPFFMRDPYTREEKVFKFVSDDTAYTETVYSGKGHIQLQINVQRLS